MPVDRQRRRPERLALFGAGALLAAPAVTAALLPPLGSQAHPLIWRCPLLHEVGCPCPACGATRAFVGLMHGDARLLHYNWTWLVWWVLACVLVLRALALHARGQPLMRSPTLRLVAAVRARTALACALPLALVAGSWAVALANVGYISNGG